MILINRGQPSPNLTNSLSLKNKDINWLNIDSLNTKSIRTFFDSDSDLKEQIRNELYIAQHGLCAYCMRKISLNPTDEEKKNQKIKIEHYVPLSKDKNLVFDYNNYFLVCTGGDSEEYQKSRKALCCDSKKKENRITIDPTKIDHIKHIQYQDDGLIKFNDATNRALTNAITQDLNITLGLNGTLYLNTDNSKYDTRTDLVCARKTAYNQAITHIKKMKKKHILTKNNLERMISKEEAKPRELSGVYLFVYRRTLYACTKP